VASNGRSQQLNWRSASAVELVEETFRARCIVLDVPCWPGHRAGEHVDVRVVAEDGGTLERSYCIASAPEDDRIALAVELVDGGEASRHLVQELDRGEVLELRGPAGEDFAWETSAGGPLLLIADGCGIVPFRAMLRHRAARGSRVPVRLLHSVGALSDVIFREDLAHSSAYDEVDVRFALTENPPPGWRGFNRQIDLEMLRQVAWRPQEQPLIYVSGSGRFVESTVTQLRELGHELDRIRTKKFTADATTYDLSQR
jgi:ferredoxin-NADP reductase